MCLILHHTETPLPGYIVQCIQQVKYFNSDIQIYLITDSTSKVDGVEVVNVNDLNVNLNEVDYYKNDQPLWRTSAFRFFYIKELIKSQNLTSVFHFDNDVLIYCDLKNIEQYCRTNYTFAITKHKPTQAVCGMVYINDVDAISNVCAELYKLLQQDQRQLEHDMQDMPNEMRLLGHISQTTKLLQELPILPTHCNDIGYVFDPSSYGQYIGGTHAACGADAGVIPPESRSRIIDSQILANNIRPFFCNERKKPFVETNGDLIQIGNLHIHSKQLHKFVSYDIR